MTRPEDPARSSTERKLADLADELLLPLSALEKPGFREAQLAAVHSVRAHFWASSRPALVVMPTGSGKTLVMLALALIMRPLRVLVVCPSVLLREQLAEAFAGFTKLVQLGALPAPRHVALSEVTSRLSSTADWQELVHSQVVIGTPSSMSPLLEGVHPPPRDLFDLVMFDEAHHVPAATYAGLADAFSSARQVLFTATPFRRDDRDISAELVFCYELARAKRDGVYGQLNFVPVEPRHDQTNDEAIAAAVEAQLKEDRADHLDHRVLVRASSKAHADELATLYAEKTSLVLRRLHSGLSSRSVKAAIQELRSGKIDGVVAVDMLGEGFDLPQLKVSGLHAPQKSLAVALQFIGRFARTSPDLRLGRATFFAVPQEVRDEAERLYVPGAEWNELVEDLSASRLQLHQELRRTIASFQPRAHDHGKDLDASERRALLWSLRPNFHVKAYAVEGPVNLDAPLELPGDLEPLLLQRSHDHHALLCIGRSLARLRWSASDSLVDIAFDLFLIVHVPTHGLLFVSTSRKTHGVYDALVTSVASRVRRLAPNEMSRVLRDVDEQEHFSVGMRNRAALGGVGAESYRIHTGPAAARAIRAGELGLYDQGHVFCRGVQHRTRVTLGFSSAAKVWSARRGTLSEFLNWCRSLATKLMDDTTFAPRSNFDRLGQATRIGSLPNRIIAAELPLEAYERTAPTVFVGEKEIALIDFRVDVAQQDATSAIMSLRYGVDELLFRFRLGGLHLFEAANAEAQRALLREATGRHEERLLGFLNSQPPTFYLADLSQVRGDHLSAAPEAPTDAMALQIESVDWHAEGVDPLVEKPAAGATLLSLFEYVEKRALQVDNVDVLFADDGANEIADYVAVRAAATRVAVQLIHCKASSTDPVPGDRVEDLYEVLGQAVKCRRWLTARALLQQVSRRAASNPSRFLRGTLATLDALLNDQTRLVFEVVVVQPGLRSRPKPPVAHLLAAADGYHRGGDSAPLRFVGTA